MNSLEQWENLLTLEDITLRVKPSEKNPQTFVKIYQRLILTPPSFPSLSMELPKEALELDEFGCLSYQGIPTFAYVKRSKIKPRARRVHFTYCDKIEEYKAGKFFCTNDIDGTLDIEEEDSSGNLIDDTEDKPESLNDLEPCRFCIGVYYGIPEYDDKDRREEIAKSFDYKKVIYDVGMSLHSSVWKSRIFEFTDTSWAELSYNLRKASGWSCEQCGLVVGEKYKIFLHTHHVSQSRDFNHEANFQVLCIGCHASQPNHETLLGKGIYKKFCKKRDDGVFGEINL